jgi:argininosuccinate lyase
MAPKERGKLWAGRFSEATDPAVERFSASIAYDRALPRYDLRGSIAHAQMLGSSGLIPEADAEAIVSGLVAIGEEIESGQFPFDAKLEDIHMNIESRLREKIGAVAGRLHTGRSRNDQVATDLMLYLRVVPSSLSAQKGPPPGSPSFFTIPQTLMGRLSFSRKYS